MENGFNNASLFAKISFFVELVGFLFHMVAFYTNSWTVYTFMPMPPHDFYVTRYIGLWKTCSANYAKYDCRYFESLASWFEAVQAFETLGFIAGIVALILIILYVFVPATSGKKIVSILSMLAAFAAAGCIILGIIIYGAKSHDLSWSFALCTIGGVLFGIAGLLLAIDMMKR